MNSGIRSFVVGSLLVATLAAFLGPLQLAGADTFSAANKLGITASDLQIINQAQNPSEMAASEAELFRTTFRTSTQRDLIVTLSAECGLYSGVGPKSSYDPPTSMGNARASADATGKVIAWLELDGNPLPTTLQGHPAVTIGSPSSGSTTTANDPAVLCSRAHNVGTQSFLKSQLLTLFAMTRDAASHTWLATSVGSGEHRLVAKAELVSETASPGSDGGVTVAHTTPAASALVGQRTLSIEAVALQSSATYSAIY
jgi:hypothetical protein